MKWGDLQLYSIFKGGFDIRKLIRKQITDLIFIIVNVWILIYIKSFDSSSKSDSDTTK